MLASPPPYSDQSGQLVYEIINSVHHELDVVPLGHAMLAVSPQDDVHVVAEDALRHLHGDVPGDVLVFEAVDEPHGTGDGDRTLQHAVVFRLSQKVHVKLVKTLLRVLGGQRPLTLLLKLLASLCMETRANPTQRQMEMKMSACE